MAWLSTTLLAACLASRVVTYEIVAPGDTDVDLPSHVEICEKAEIWNSLTADPTVEGVENINFKSIHALIESQLDSYGDNMVNMRKQIQELKERIQEAEAKERNPSLTSEDADQLIGKALAPFAVDGFSTGVEVAKKSSCGRNRMLVSDRQAFKKAVEGFTPVAKAFFKESGAVFDQEVFYKQFKELVGLTGYCKSLAQRLRDQAVEVSPPWFPTVSPALKLQLKEIEVAMQAEEEKREQCTQAQEGIGQLETEIMRGKSEISNRFDDVMAAEDLFYESDETLGELEKSIIQSEGELEEVLQKLASDDKAVTDAKTAVDSLKGKEAGLRKQLSETSAALLAVEEKLGVTREADEVIKKLRAAARLTTLKMRLYFEAFALRPAMRVGLSRSTDIDAHFPTSLSDPNLVEGLHHSVRNLVMYCEKVVQPFFNAPDSSVGYLSPLCETGSVTSIQQNMQVSMETQVNKVKGLIHEVQSWFDPYKGQREVGMNEMTVRKRVDKGELEGLREIIGVYGTTKFYKYLRGWRLNGKYQHLIKGLWDLGEKLEVAVAALKEDLNTLRSQAQSALKEREAAETKLKEAKAAESLTQDQKEAVEEALVTLQEDTANMQKQLEDYAAMLEKAIAQWEAAKKALVKAHSEGIGKVSEDDTKGLL